METRLKCFASNRAILSSNTPNPMWVTKVCSLMLSGFMATLKVSNLTSGFHKTYFSLEKELETIFATCGELDEVLASKKCMVADQER